MLVRLLPSRYPTACHDDELSRASKYLSSLWGDFLHTPSCMSRAPSVVPHQIFPCRVVLNCLFAGLFFYPGRPVLLPLAGKFLENSWTTLAGQRRAEGAEHEARGEGQEVRLRREEAAEGAERPALAERPQRLQPQAGRIWPIAIGESIVSQGRFP